MGRPGEEPLSRVLARVLVAFTGDHESAGRVPSLPLWANLLRVVGEVDGDGLGLRDAPRLARLSRRQTGPLLTHGERHGLLTVDRSGGRGRATARLTAVGAAAHDAGRAGLRRTEAAWHERFGPGVDRLRDGLEGLVGRLDLEHPHFPMGYGPADHSVTGGRVVPARPGPPALPAHGTDWRPVIRDGPGTAAGLPLSALLSQAVTGFAVDYEGVDSVVAVPLTTGEVLQAIGDEGVPARRLPPLHGWTGHGIVTMAPAVTGRGTVVRPTGRGAAARDAHLRLAADVEAGWRRRYGADLVGEVRAAAEAIDGDLGPVAPNHRVVSLTAGLVTAS